MSAVDIAALGAFLASAETHLSSLVRPVRTLEASISCLAAERVFASDEVSSTAVVDGLGRVGLLSRGHFLALLSGRLGYGRALLSRTPVGELVDWTALVLQADAPVTSAAHQAVSRPIEHRYDDVLVRGDHDLGVVTTARLVESMAILLATRSVRDQLTGLASRDLLFHRLHELCAAVSGTEDRVAVVYLDLDDFKSVNDTLGHAVGDRLLTSVARRLESAALPTDLVGRLGGDEFAVVMALPAFPGGHAEQVARDIGGRFRAAVVDDLILDPGHACRASVGVAVAGPGEADPESLLREADMAMYAAKRSGSGVTVTTDVTATLAPRAPLLRTALDQGWLRVHAQAIHEVATGKLASIEVLARVQHPDLGLVGPGEFLYDAPDDALCALDEAMLRAATRQLLDHERTWARQVTPYLNVNLSVPSLVLEDLDTRVFAILEESGFPTHRLRLEVPEVADLAAVQKATPRLQSLRDAGVAVTLDDMGSGSSSLRHISRLAVDGMKIDRSFVSGIVDNERDLAVVRMLIDLGAGLGLTVTAEGVETAEQLEVLRDLHCPYVQGFFLAHPEPLAEVLAARQPGDASVPD
ncbi:MAG: EAL domain-containing protein [Nocardioidaceae bacterium]